MGKLSFLESVAYCPITSGFASSPLLTHPSPYIWLTMLGVRLPIRCIRRGQGLIPDDQYVLGILLLGRLREDVA